MAPTLDSGNLVHVGEERTQLCDYREIGGSIVSYGARSREFIIDSALVLRGVKPGIADFGSQVLRNGCSNHSQIYLCIIRTLRLNEDSNESEILSFLLFPGIAVLRVMMDCGVQ